MRLADLIGGMAIKFGLLGFRLFNRATSGLKLTGRSLGKGYLRYSRKFFLWLGNTSLQGYSRLKKTNWSIPYLRLTKFQFPTIAVTQLLQRIQTTRKPLPAEKNRISKKPSPAKPIIESYIAPHQSSYRKRLIFGVVGLAALVIYSIFLVKLTNDIPSPDRLSHLATPSTTEFYDRNGKLLYRLYEGRNRSKVTLSELPQYLIDATIAIEDKRFYQHHGVDISGIARSLVVYLTQHQIQGGSTLTQQLIKNTLLTTDRTIERKIKEIVLALWTESVYNKKQILEMYFNEVPYGGPAWGVEAAAQTYFGKPVKNLTLAEAAYLAGLPASPTVYSWFGSDPELGIQRQQQVLRAMLEDGKISESDYRIASSEKLRFASVPNSIKAPHFVMWIRQQLAEKYGERTVSQGGLKVYTTLDLDIQQMAERTVADEVAKLGYLHVTNGAAMVTDPRTGEVLAMVGSKDYYSTEGGNFNVTVATRQPGSSIKPITYATAFKQGYSPGNVLLDVPTNFKNSWENYAPVNYDGKFHGVVTMRTALGSSFNIPAVKTLALVGIDNMVQTARDLGITTFNDLSRFGLSLTLGGGEVKMVDMMSAYGTFADGGIRHTVTGINRVLDSSGVVLEDIHDNTGVRALSPEVSYLVNNVLSDNTARTPAFGPNSLLNIPGHTVAVKTGTTDLKRDNWTFGYTPKYVVGVWVGNNDNSPMNQQLSSGVTGAAPIWNKLMSQLLENEPDVAFVRPSGITNVTIDGHKDLGIAGLSTKSAVKTVTKKQKDGEQEKDVVTFTDPFSQQAQTVGNPQ